MEIVYAIGSIILIIIVIRGVAGMLGFLVRSESSYEERHATSPLCGPACFPDRLTGWQPETEQEHKAWPLVGEIIDPVRHSLPARTVRARNIIDGKARYRELPGEGRRALPEPKRQIEEGSIPVQIPSRARSVRQRR